MIKHGPIQKFEANPIFPSHLSPIKEHVTRGIADAREDITLDLRSCDVRGAKKHNGQNCVIAKALTRLYKPQAVAVGRSLAYVVFRGLAVRLRVEGFARNVVEEWDSRGRVRVAPVVSKSINKTWRLGTPQRGESRPKKRTGKKRARVRKLGVRAIGGGVTH